MKDSIEGMLLNRPLPRGVRYRRKRLDPRLSKARLPNYNLIYPYQQTGAPGLPTPAAQIMDHHVLFDRICFQFATATNQCYKMH